MALRELHGETLADQAYVALREAIISGELDRGERVTERGLAERLGVSATPVREAMRRLEQDRLLDRTGLRSVKIAEYSVDTISEIVLVEGHLRALGARFAARNATAGDLDRMESLLDRADAVHGLLTELDESDVDGRIEAAAEALDLVRQFHDVVDHASQNRVLVSFLGTVDAFKPAVRHEVLREQVRAGDPGPARRFVEHRMIFEAIRSRDEALAEKLMLNHAATGSFDILATQTASDDA